MSSGLFHTDWYTDPPWDDVSLSWLINYVKNIRTNPVLSRAVAAEKEQFEMVPMPREVIQHLASSRRVTTSVGLLGDAAFQNVGPVQQLVRQFSQALENEKLEEAVALLSPNYQDANGRDAAKIKEQLRSFLAAASGLRIVPFSTDNVVAIGDKLLANIQVAWDAKLKEATGSAHKSGSIQVELVLEKKDRGGWAISGIRFV